jgi:hypothetical protein
LYYGENNYALQYIYDFVAKSKIKKFNGTDVLLHSVCTENCGPYYIQSSEIPCCLDKNGNMVVTL